MAYVDKILIRGIRSFDPENEATLTLYRPLTLIVGSNGAGKTTIIECLRMACTGLLPPHASSGHSFVHDPKVAKETEVKAQIRLRFCTPTNDAFLVIRSFQLTQRVASMRFERLDQTLQREVKDTKKHVAITQTCADINKIVPNLLGISQAVLNNVVFVHQDEAHWPFADGKVLKEKFDLLFATSKYASWFEDVKKLKTKKTQELKVKNAELEHFKTRKKYAANLKVKFSKMDNEVISIQSEIQELNLQIQEASENMQGVEALMAKFLKKENEIITLKCTLETIQTRNDEMKSKLDEGDYEDPTEKLIVHMEKCTRVVKQKQETIKELDEDLSKAQLTSLALQDKYSKLCPKKGKLQAEVESKEKCIKERDVFCQNLKKEGIVKTFENSNSCLLNLEKVVASMEENLKKMKTLHRSRDQQLAQALQNATFKTQNLRKELNEASEALHRDKEHITLINQKIETLGDEEHQLKELEKEEEKLNSDVEKNRELQTDSTLVNGISKAVNEIQRIDVCIKQLREDKSELSGQTELVTKIRLKKNEIDKKKAQIDAILVRHQSQISETLKQDVEPEKLKQTHDVVLKKLQEEFLAAEKELQEVCSAEMLVLNKLESTKSELGKQKEALSMAQDSLQRELFQIVEESCTVEAYEAHLVNNEKKSRECLENVSLAEANMKLLEKYIQGASKDNQCPVCLRAFDSDDHKQDFIQTKTKELESLPQDISDKEDLMKIINEKVKNLKKLQSVWLEHKHLEEIRIPELQSQEIEFLNRAKALRAEVQEAQSIHEAIKKDLKLADQLLEDVIWPISTLLKELIPEEDSLKALDLSCVQVSSHGRSLMEVEEALENQELLRNHHEQERDKIQHEQHELSVKYLKLTEQCQRTHNQIEKLRQTVRERQDLKLQIEGLKKKEGEIQEQIDLMKKEMGTLSPQETQLESELRQHRQTVARTESETEREFLRIHGLLKELEQKMQAAREYEEAEQNPSERLKQIENQLEEVAEKQTKLQNMVKEKEYERREEQEIIQNFTSLQRYMECCLEWRKGKKEEESILHKIDQIGLDLKEIDSKKALDHTLKTNQGELEKLKSRKSKLEGSLSTIQESRKEIEKDLRSEEYFKVDEAYKAALIDKMLTESGTSDLQIFLQTCEKALLTYHTMKMEEVNATMRDLWRSIYRGTDIEYIEIKAEAPSGATSRSCYNYWLSMFTNGTELPMRGRCSAGQKVLAGIIVRLALAETFCSKCGILALDEPTTNLDEANVNSLADALRDIIENRGQQEHFQLIVITHDDAFAKRLQSRQHAEFMWRVTKNEQQHTVLTKERI